MTFCQHTPDSFDLNSVPTGLHASRHRPHMTYNNDNNDNKNNNNDNNNDIAFQLKPDIAICQKAILVHVGKHVESNT